MLTMSRRDRGSGGSESPRGLSRAERGLLRPLLLTEARRALELRDLAADIAVEGPHLIHVRAHIPAGVEQGTQPGDLPSEVQEAHGHGHPGGEGDVVEAGLP